MAGPRTVGEVKTALRFNLRSFLATSTPPRGWTSRSHPVAQISRTLCQSQGPMRRAAPSANRISRIAQILRPFRNRRLVSNDATKTPSPHPTPHLGSPEPAPSLSARLKKLSKEYGWTAVGVYLALSALDFPFCFLAVRLLGTDRIGHWEHVIVESFSNVVRKVYPGFREKALLAGDDGGVGATEREGEISTVADVAANGDSASLWTQLVLAYAVHKSLIFIRVPITAAILPKVVKTLRGWGWNIGKKSAKPT